MYMSHTKLSSAGMLSSIRSMYSLYKTVRRFNVSLRKSMCLSIDTRSAYSARGYFFCRMYKLMLLVAHVVTAVYRCFMMD